MERGPTSLLEIDPSGFSFVHSASFFGDLQALSLLFFHLSAFPADRIRLANLQDKNGNTPLHLVAQLSEPTAVEMCDLLLMQSADLLRTNCAGETPAHIAASLGSPTFPFLLGNANVLLQKDCNGNTLVMSACRGNQLEVLTHLSEVGASLNEPGQENLTPLMAATRMGFNSVATFLIDHKVNLDVADFQGNTVLHWAAATNNVEITRLYLKRSRKTTARNERNCRRETAILLAAREGHAEIVRLLLAAKVKNNLKDHRGQTCLDVAKDEETRNLLLAAGARSSQVSPTTEGDHEDESQEEDLSPD